MRSTLDMAPLFYLLAIWSHNLQTGLLVLLLSAGIVSPGFGQQDRLQTSPRQQQALPGTPDMPELVSRPDWRVEPTFVSAEKAFLPTGQLDTTLFTEAAANSIGFLLSQPAVDGCVRFDWVSSEDLPHSERDTFDMSVIQADNVLVATVTGSTPGFEDGIPGTLLRLSSNRVFKGKERRDFYLFYWVGEFSVGDKRICQKNPNYASLPKIGEEVLLLISDYWWNESGSSIRVKPTGIFPIKSGGLVDLPPYYGNSDPEIVGKTKDQIFQRVGDLLRSGGS